MINVPDMKTTDILESAIRRAFNRDDIDCFAVTVCFNDNSVHKVQMGDEFKIVGCIEMQKASLWVEVLKQANRGKT